MGGMEGKAVYKCSRILQENCKKSFATGEESFWETKKSEAIVNKSVLVFVNDFLNAPNIEARINVFNASLSQNALFVPVETHSFNDILPKRTSQRSPKFNKINQTKRSLNRQLKHLQL